MRKSKGIKLEHDPAKARKHWDERPEPGWKRFKFNQPYEKGLRRLQEEVLGKTNFDPATLFQWGTMQAMAVIGILKNVEAKFGAEGQAVVYDSLRAVGYDIGKQITEGAEFPEGMSITDAVSYFTTVINTIAYASLESPEIVEQGYVNFHIDWCPHQDHYGASDCRVQRYFVQGMIDACVEWMEAAGHQEKWDVMFQSTIPAGAPTCLFHVHQSDTEAGARWQKYTAVLEARELKKSQRRGYVGAGEREDVEVIVRNG